MKNADYGAFRQGALNTLAESGTAAIPNPVAILQGKGAEMGGVKSAKSRSKRKFIGQAVALMLVDIARRKGDEEMLKACWNSYHCQSRIFTHQGRIYGRYCKNRFCPLCCSIRKADFINRYLPVIKCWEDPHFVTLTVKACPAKNLPKLIEAMMRVMRKIIARHRKRHQRGTGNGLLGIRSLECNFNPQRRTYNPHFHLVVPDKQTAQTLIRDWLELVKNGYSTGAAQHYRPVGKLDADLIETINTGARFLPIRTGTKA
jgi:hypothetical protein